MTDKPKRSPAYKLTAHLWASIPRPPWERLNHSLRKGLTLAIGSGMEFEPGDFVRIMDDFGGYYWAGENLEWCYADAILVGNTSAIKTFEHDYKRTPIIADDVKHGCGQDTDGFTHSIGKRKQERLFVGAWFSFRGERPQVTSFRGGKAIAVLYDRVKRGRGKHVYYSDVRRPGAGILRIGPEEIKVDRAERKEREAIFKRCNAEGVSEETKATWRRRMLKLGVTKPADFWRCPIDKLRKAVA